ncbi:mevalonate diphosphate decarboxylase 1 [Corchorus olitorius]|uniref:Mevalonate diphosphate decarboxylase 1 n=1 Tax=Corchorus olitorius TaxID=93759 RepID=A0A1R3JN63_9ROSI|nr:mevalonate diphosphate decarboxylase 1 [Corchorus olitorius]
MKASILLVATLLLFGILDGISPRLCYGRDNPMNFHQMQHERIALEAVQRLKFSGSLWNNRYPPPKSNRKRAQGVSHVLKEVGIEEESPKGVKDVFLY